jgi:hypothetical protein
MAALFAAEAQRTIWQRLDEATRGRLVLTLAGLLLLVLVILLIALSARMMRRMARHRPPQRLRETSDWDSGTPAKLHPPSKNSDDAEH